MIGSKRSRAILVGLLLTSAVTSHAQELPSQSYDLSFSKGIHAINQKRYEEALDAFQQALKAKPLDIEATYYLGFAQRLVGQHQKAIKTFVDLMGLDSSFQQVHYDLGIAYYELDRYDEALRELGLAESSSGIRQATTQYYLGLTYQKLKRYREAAHHFLRAATQAPELEASARYLAGAAFHREGMMVEAQDELEIVVRIERAPDILDSARELLNRIETDRLQQKRLSLRATLGGQYDSNVVLLPEDAPLPSAISEEGDLRMVGALQAGLRVFQAARWNGTADYQFYQSLHQDLDRFDVQSHEMGLTLQHRPSTRYQFEFFYSFSDALVDQDDYLRTHTAGTTIGFSRSPAHLTQVEYRYQNKDFQESDFFLGNEGRTGINQAFALRRYWFFADQKGNLRGAYAYNQEMTRADDWDDRGHHLDLGMTLPASTLGGWIQVDLEAEMILRFYDHPNTLSDRTPPEEREDQIQIYTLTISRALASWFSVSVQYLYTINASNIPAYDYDRQIGSTFVTVSY